MKLQRSVANVGSATPAEIDGVLFPLEGQLQWLQRQLADYYDRASDPKDSEVMRARYRAEADRFAKEHAGEIAELRADIASLVAEYQRRGGWQRITFCLSYGGHYHRESYCHTTRGSALTWVAELSGLTDNEVIERVGYRACSQDECFPTAPLHPAWAISEQRDKDAQAAAREAKYAKGLATRQKKVANIQKRIDKASEKIARYAGASDPHSQEAILRSYAESDLKWEMQSLQYAQRDLDRWVAKRK